MFLVGVGVKNVFELYSSRLTSLILVVYLYLAYLILSQGWVVEISDSKENPKSDLDLDLRFVNIPKLHFGYNMGLSSPDDFSDQFPVAILNQE